jgi:hypothetical protein
VSSQLFVFQISFYKPKACDDYKCQFSVIRIEDYDIYFINEWLIHQTERHITKRPFGPPGVSLHRYFIQTDVALVAPSALSYFQHCYGTLY